jgi:methionyl-tRNA formyltransferase
VDTGPIVLQEKVNIDPEDTVKSLYFKKLYPMGIKMVAEAVRLIREGNANPKPQDDAHASFQPVITESDTLIDWSQPTQPVYNLIRGSNPAPGAVSSWKGERLKIWECLPCTDSGKPGEVLEIRSGEGFIVSTGDGSILVQRVQYKDSGKIAAEDFSKDFSLRIGDRLGS